MTVWFPVFMTYSKNKVRIEYYQFKLWNENISDIRVFDYFEIVDNFLKIEGCDVR